MDADEDPSWLMKIDQKTPKHFIKYIGRSVPPSYNFETLTSASKVQVESFEPLEPLRVHQEKKRFQLETEDKFAQLILNQPKMESPDESQSVNYNNEHKILIEVGQKQLEEDEKDSRLLNSSTELAKHDYESESKCSGLTESNSQLSSDISRSVIGLIQRAIAAPRVKHELLSEVTGSERDLTGLELSPMEKLRMQKARSAEPPEEVFGPRDNMQPEVFVQKAIEQNGIVIFGYSKCPFCARLQYILEMHERSYTMLRLDKMGAYGKQVFSYLSDNWIDLNVPNVYFHGKHFNVKDLEKNIAGNISDLKKDLTSHDPTFYDLIIMGGGPEGSAAALKAAELKKKVCLIDCIDVSRERPFWVLGKTGLNIGSVPKRYMFQAAIDCIDLHDSKYYGWDQQSFCLKWSFLVRDIWRELKKANWEYRVNLRKAGVSYLNCEAVLADPHMVEVFNQEMKKFTLKSKYILITVGAQAYIPKIQGAEYCITSDEIFLQQRVPGKVLIFGGSTVGVEYAFILRQLGFPVTVMVPGSFMRNVDGEIVEEILNRMNLLGIELVRECLLIRVEPIKTSEDLENGDINQSDKYAELLKNQLVDFSDDYIDLWKSETESAAEIHRETQDRVTELDDEIASRVSEEVKADGMKPNFKSIKLSKRLSSPHSSKESTFGSVNSSKSNCDGDVLESLINVKIGEVVMDEFEKNTKNVSHLRERNIHSTKLGNGRQLFKNRRRFNLPRGIKKLAFVQNFKSKRKECPPSKFNNSRIKKDSKPRELGNVNTLFMKQKSIFSYCAQESQQNVFRIGKKEKIYCKRKVVNVPTYLDSSHNTIIKNDGTMNNTSDIRHDGPKAKGKGKKGKGKKGKGKKDKKGNKKKTKKKTLIPIETESQKALREKNENLLRFLTQIITTKKLRESGLTFPSPKVEETRFERQPTFSVVGLYGNGSLHRGTYNTIVIAAGEETTTGNFGFPKIGLNINPGTGKIYTNKNDQTNIENIYAVGDIVEGKVQGNPAAVCAATYVVQRLFAKSKNRMNNLTTTGLMFLPPSEYSFLGLTESSARESLSGDIRVYKKWFRPVDTIFCHRNTTHSLIKVICHVEKNQLEKVVGLHIFGRNAGYTVQGFTSAMRKGLYVHDLEKLTATDLTNAEKLIDIEFGEDKRLEERKIAQYTPSRLKWDEELKELQELHSFEEMPVEEEVREEEEPPSEILIALERSDPLVVIDEVEIIEEEGVPPLKPRGTDSSVKFLLRVTGDKKLLVARGDKVIKGSVRRESGMDYHNMSK